MARRAGAWSVRLIADHRPPAGAVDRIVGRFRAHQRYPSRDPYLRSGTCVELGRRVARGGPQGSQAEDSVTYEIVSTQGDVPAANVEYNANSERKALQ